MKASTLPKKTSKSKLKKSIKNVICRPDQLLWPEITEDQQLTIETILMKYKVDIPEFIKPHWRELKLIPKENRPKPPKLKKVEGLLFGISECSNAIPTDSCSAIIIESTVNPRMIVEPIIEMCTSRDIPLLCMKHLRKLCLINFGVNTSCLGVKTECLQDVQHAILDISKLYSKRKANDTKNVINIEKDDVKTEEFQSEMVMDTMTSESPYLYRTNKKTRVFVPQVQEIVDKTCKNFIGQDFIQLSDKQRQTNDKKYRRMMLKRISNNPERVKKK